MSLDRKIMLGFATCLLVLATVAYLSFNNSKKFIETSNWVNHTQEVLYEFEQVMVMSLSCESGVRAYVITGKDNFLEHYTTAKTKIYEHIDNIKTLTADNPFQQKNVAELKKQVDDLQDYHQECIALRQESFEAASKLINTGRGKFLQDKIRGTVGHCKKSEQNLLTARKEASEEDANNFMMVFVVLIAAILVVLIVVYFMITANLRALRKAEAETAAKNWNLTGTSQLTASMEGNKLVKELAQGIIDHLVTYVNAQVGSFYITSRNDLGLEWMSGHSTSENKKNKHVPLGEGIIGQSALQKTKVLVREIDPGYFPVQTSLGNITPRFLIALPFVAEGQVVGVIEIGSVRELTEMEILYLESCMPAIAISVVAAQSREEVRELLEETQRQSEELEVQQEELKQSNEELSEKTNLLEKSEAELKAQQEELQQSNEELIEQTRLLEDQKEKLEHARMEMEAKARELELTGKYKSDFLANMSHELRTPLNSILILSELMGENKSKVLGPKEIEFSRSIHKSGTDLLNLINEILDLSKIEAGKMELDIENVELADIVQDINSMFTGMATKKSITFKVSCSDALENASITTDKQRVEQVIKNLLSNAFKFTGMGGTVELKIEQAPHNTPYRQSKLGMADKVISFTVTDSGIGIPEDKRALIFEAFQQADGSTKRKYGGTGLGLSISRELTFALGGEIQLHSEEGKGSSFTLFLPMKFDTSLITATEKQVEVREKITAPSNGSLHKPKNKKEETVHQHVTVPLHEDNKSFDDRNTITESDKIILIMEDDEAFARVLLDFVRRRKYKGIVAAQGNSGISFARHYKPDAIVLDMNLPVMDGMEVLKLLKNDPQLRHIPVQIISAYDKKQTGLEMGAFDYISKPVSVNDLQHAFEKIESFTSKKLKKLLVVEDNEEHNQAIRELVGNGDVKCFPAYSGHEALEALNKGDVDCVILDLGLPDISGFELLEKIKSVEALNKIPVVVYTGRSLSNEENNRLGKLASTVILKTADSHERLLDETALFLHRVESKLPAEKQNIIRKLHKSDEILRDKKVLLVDDDIRNIYSLTNALEEEGIRCIAAENGKEALEELEADPNIDLVLLDIMMPEMDGYETIEAIRNIPEFSKLPVIALTAKAMKGDREKCLASGMSDYIAKPVNVEQLLGLMRVWLYK